MQIIIPNNRTGRNHYIFRLRKIRRIIWALGFFGILKTLFYNFKILPFKQAYRLPIIISKKTTIYLSHKRCIKFEDPKPRFGSLRFGLSDLEFTYDCNSFVNIIGEIIIKGTGFHVFAPGLSLNIRENGVLIIGNNFSTAPHLRLTCSKKITIGEDNMWSFYNLVMDTDSHHIYDEDNKLINAPKEIEFANHCWLGAYCKVLKGAFIPEGCIIGSGSIVTKRLEIANSIYLNNRMIRERITWNRKLL